MRLPLAGVVCVFAACSTQPGHPSPGGDADAQAPTPAPTGSAGSSSSSGAHDEAGVSPPSGSSSGGAAGSSSGTPSGSSGSSPAPSSSGAAGSSSGGTRPDSGPTTAGGSSSGDAGNGSGVSSSGGADGGNGNGVLAGTPPMGWNSWNKFQGSVDDMVIRQIADAMVSSGMAAAGYQYVVIDDTWQGSRSANGTIMADTSGTPSRFPDMKALADYVHSRGLKFGIYSDRGTMTCAGKPGSFGFETNDAQTYASWGVDYLKYDNCNPGAGRTTDMATQQDYTTMRDALRAAGRPIVFSISAWWYFPWEPSVGNLWRTTTDIQDTWVSVMGLLDRNGGDTTRYGNCTTCPAATGGSCVTCNMAVPEAAYGAPGIAQAAGPGHWNDPDMLEVGNGGMTDTEYRSHISLWAIMAAPRIAGTDLRSMTQTAHDILTNAEVIAVDQDALGAQGQPVSTSTTLEVWSKKLAGASTYAVALLNRTDSPADISVSWSTLGLTTTSAAVRDLWAHQDLGTMATQYTATAVPSHGVAMIKVTGQ